ncbi:MAG: hypothetical protein ACOY17_00770 [Pseudomonadota bacterium]|jgi:uncharacterized membrane protein
MAILQFGDHKIRLPQSRTLRILLGLALVLGGVVGFLPVVGFWMLPLGILVLSIDLHPIRRWRRRAVVKWERRKRRRNSQHPPRDEYYD